MQTFEKRIIEVENHFNHKDLNLAYRRLIDLVLDLQQLELYRNVIIYSNIFYDDTVSEEIKISTGFSLINTIKSYPNPTKKEDEELLVVSGIEKVYNKRKFKLHPISFQLKLREIIGLVGENGNGKTTLLRLICGDLKPTAGKLYYAFTPAKQFSFDLKSQLIYIPQRIDILYGSLMNNLQFTLSAYEVKGEENFLLAQVMLARLGLWQYRDLEWRQLSSGYKMRFELAKTLLRRPKLLLLDEPLANLDILAQQIILEDLKYLAQSFSNPFGVVLSSQQLYEVEKISNKVIFLENGKLKSNEIDNNTDDQFTIVEIDVVNSKEELLTLLKNLQLHEIKYNGGSYIAYFNKDVSMGEILTQLGNSDLDVKYIRDISYSSRRFFVN